MKNLSTSQRSRVAPGPMPETVRDPAAPDCMYTVCIAAFQDSVNFTEVAFHFIPMKKIPSSLGSKLALVLVALAVLASVPSALAVSATWNGTTDALWATTTNWSASPVPGTGNTATFNNAGNGNTTITVGTISLSNITFDTINVAAYMLGTGADTITFADGTTTAVNMNSAVTANETINANITLGTAIASTTTFQNDSTGLLTLGGNITGGGAAAKTVTVAGAGNTAMSGIISNGAATSVALTKTGLGTLTLSGANGYTGATTISGGVLKIGNASALGTTAGATTVNAGGVLDLAGVSIAEPLTINGAGQNGGGALIDSAGGGSLTGTVALGSGSTINVGTGTVTINNATGITGNFLLDKVGTGTLTVIDTTTTSARTGVNQIDAGTLQVQIGRASCRERV